MSKPPKSAKPRWTRRAIVLSVITFVALCVWADVASAETLSFSIETKRESLIVEGPDDSAMVLVRESGFAQTGVAGEPSLPYRVVSVLLPQGQQVASFEAVPRDEQVMRYDLTIAPTNATRLDDGLQVAGSTLVTRSGDVFPGIYGRYLSTGYLHGRAIASFAVFPVRQVGRDLVLNEAIELRVTTEPADPALDVVVRERHRDGFDNRIDDLISTLVINPETSQRYSFGGVRVADQPGGFQPTSYPSLEGRPVDYLIITTENLADEYQVLADWKTEQGVPTVVRTIEWIQSNAINGVDIQETIRFFVRDAYTQWGIQYLLLGGDTDILPTRYALSRYWPPGGQTQVPTDLYFGCLDGSWNGNHDQNWGEPVLDNPDFYAEVYHGRLPISDPADVTRMIDRIMRYASAENPDYMNKCLVLAEVLFPEDWVEGETVFTNGTIFSEYIYDAILDTPTRNVARMYQTEELYPGSVEENKAAVMDSLNAGFNHVLHIGHGYRHNISVADASIRSPDADTLSNDGRWFNLYMLNCTAAAYDYFCLAEHLLQNPNGGAVSVVGSDEVAFPYASSYYMNEYYDVMFLQGAVHIGEAFARSRLPRTPLATGSDEPDAWTHFMYSLLADPTMQLFTAAVQTPDVAHPGSAGLGPNSIPFTVTAGGSPVDSAVICLTKGDDDYETVITDGAGQATVHFTTESAGSISVVVTGLNLARSQSYIVVDMAPAAHISVATIAVDDDSAGGTSGNGDGAVDAGEVVDLVIDLVNTGGSSAGGVWLALGSTDASATVVDATAQYGDIDASATKSTSDAVRVAFDPGIPDETDIEFSLAILDSNSMVWNDRFEQLVHAPVMELTTLRIDDTATGDGDGIVGAGEELRLYYELKNYGTGTANGLSAHLEDIDGAFTFMQPTDSYPDIGMLVAQENTSGFLIMETDTTTEHRLRIVINDIYSRTHVDTIELRPPLPPSSLSFDASLGPDELSVAWLHSPSSDVAKYNVYRSTSASGPFVRANPDLIEHAVYVNAGLAPTTQYFFYVTAVDSSGNESVPSPVYSASTNPPQMAGFPIQMTYSSVSSPAVGDIDGDGDNEIVVGNEFVYAWHADGLELRDGDNDPRTWGVLNTDGDQFAAGIALANIDDSPGLDIIAADLYTGTVFCMNYNGELLPGWPQQGGDQFRASPVAGDLDGDGRVEVIAVDIRGVLYAWHRDGSEVMDGDSNPSTPGVFFRSPRPGAWHYSTPSVCDIDADFKDEIILGTALDTVYALNGDGSSVPGWPFAMSGEMVGGAVAGYIDDDYFPEIVVRSGAGEVYLLNHDGTVRTPGWPRSIPYTEAYYRATPAIADVDGDGRLDIVLAHHSTAPLESRIYVIDRDGNDLPGWPVIFATQFSECSPVVADVDGDGFLDIVMGDEQGFICGFDRNGDSLAGFPIATSDAVRGTPFITDVDGDGDEDMVVHSWDQNLYVYDFTGAHVPGSGQWPTIHSNAHRNGRAGYTVATGISGATFSFSVHHKTVSLTWVLAAAPGGGAYDIYRAEEDGAVPGGFVTIASRVSGDPGGVLRVDDGGVEIGKRYVYKLVSQDDPGDVFITHSIYVPVTRAELRQNYPNPFNPTTQIAYYIPEGAPQHASLVIYDVTGARVRTLVNGMRGTGRHVETWDGRDGGGRQVASGIYFYRLVSGQFTATKRMMMLK
jgi:hypothetical protein